MHVRIHRYLIVVLGFLLGLPLCAQQKPRSHDECIERVPGDWGSRFGIEWHAKEAIYWACRLGVAPETVRSWQVATDEVNGGDIAQNILLARVPGQEIVLFEEMGGRLDCVDLKALTRGETGWGMVWRLPIRRNSMDYCSGACPRLKFQLTKDVLSVESATTSDLDEDWTSSCKHVSWQTEKFRWNGSTFEPLGRPSDR